MSKLKRPLKYPADRPVGQDLELTPLADPYFTDDAKADAYFTNDATTDRYETLDN